MAPMDSFMGFKVVNHEDCPLDMAYILDPQSASTIAQYPDVAKAIAEGKTSVVTSRQIAEKVEAAVRRVGRIDL